MPRVVAISLIVLLFLSTTLTQIPGVSAITLGQSYTTTKKLIGIQFEPICNIFLKMNQTCGGMTYKTLQPLDTTNPRISGTWVKIPYYHRELPRTTNAWTSYDTPFVVMVDPDPNYSVRAMMIIVKPDHFTYVNKDEIVTNGTRIEYHDRFVQSCNQATVYANYTLIQDTINYLENGCTKTNYNEKVKVTIKQTKSVVFNPFSSTQYDNQLKNIFHGISQLHNEKLPTGGGLGPGNCITHKCDFIDPYKKQGY